MRSNARRNNQSSGLTDQDRRRRLLDDLRHELARLADAVERQNELLEDTDLEADR